MDPLVQVSFDMGMERSATFRGLLDALRNSDLIVYIGSESLMAAPVIGEIHFLTSAGPHRYLRVLVKSELSPWDRAAMIAHELQHALEVAAAPEVRDTAAMDALYDRIGYRIGLDRHETEAAKLAGAIVQRELRAVSPASGAR